MLRRSLSSSVHNFKHLHKYRLANQSQILYGASMDRENESSFVATGSNDQDGHHAHPICGKTPSKFFFSETSGPISMKLGMYYR